MRYTATIVGIVFLAALARIIPHPPNFTPIAAMALFGATYFRDKRVALILPVMTMAVSDCLLEIVSQVGLTSGWMAAGWGFHSGWWVIYLSVIAITALGFLLRQEREAGRVIAVTLASSALFFFITNFAVWASEGMYPLTLDGLVTCFVMAIPFAQWTVVGDLAYVAVIFGAYELALKPWATRYEPQLQLS